MDGRTIMTHSTASRIVRGPHQWLALIVGIVYLLVGALGFLVTGFDGFMEHDDSQKLLWFAINPLHNIVHLVIGILGIGLWPMSGGARAFGWLLLLGYGAAFVYGLYAVDNPEINYLNINQPDNWLHLGSALVGLLIAVWPARRRRTVVEPGPTGTMPYDAR
jgi:ABC-type transport system involved in multi-copper enzyme maturation permease subunit